MLARRARDVHCLCDAPRASLLVSDGDEVRGTAAGILERQTAFVPRLRLYAKAAETGEGQGSYPRHPTLTNPPYALKAADADTVGGKPLSAFVLAGDTTGTVLYQFLPPMLLNEVQKQQRTIEAEAADLANQAVRFDAKAKALQAENDALRAQLAALADRLARLETRNRH